MDHKIFVGNIPFTCKQEEFTECFSNVDGFVRGEIITLHNTNVSRGFGFITVKSPDYIDKIKNRTDIICKGRVLRFTEYKPNKSVPSNAKPENKYLYINNIPQGKNREWLKNFFSDYEPIGKCFICVNRDTGIIRDYGIIEIVDDDKCRELLSLGKITKNNITLTISPNKFHIL